MTAMLSYEQANAATGHWQKSNSALPLSAFPPGADIAASAGDVRKVPKPDSCTAAISIAIRLLRRVTSRVKSAVTRADIHDGLEHNDLQSEAG